jgi:uncharacterized YigZ family protein
MSSFKTIAKTSEGIYKEKGSKFLAFAYPVASEDQIKGILDVLKKDHPKARHICFAYRLGADKMIFRSNDAGEPHNSAGQPILGQIKSLDLTNVLVAVVRYFGGTKVGIPGLTAAYKDAARDALQNAEIMDETEQTIVTIETDYTHLSELLNFVKQNNVRILDQNLEEHCRIQVSIPKDELILFSANIAKLQKVKLI